MQRLIPQPSLHCLSYVRPGILNRDILNPSGRKQGTKSVVGRQHRSLARTIQIKQKSTEEKKQYDPHRRVLSQKGIPVCRLLTLFPAKASGCQHCYSLVSPHRLLGRARPDLSASPPSYLACTQWLSRLCCGGLSVSAGRERLVIPRPINRAGVDGRVSPLLAGNSTQQAPAGVPGHSVHPLGTAETVDTSDLPVDTRRCDVTALCWSLCQGSLCPRFPGPG